MESVRLSALAIKHKLEDARADEVQVKFGLTTTGKLGNFAIGEVGISANYEVTLTWKNPPAAAGGEKVASRWSILSLGRRSPGRVFPL